MLDMDNYVAAASVGYEGLAFYFGGRGGVLVTCPSTTWLRRSASFQPHRWRLAGRRRPRSKAGTNRQCALPRPPIWAAKHLPDDGLTTSEPLRWQAGSLLPQTLGRPPSSTGGVACPSPSRRVRARRASCQCPARTALRLSCRRGASERSRSVRCVHGQVAGHGRRFRVARTATHNERGRPPSLGRGRSGHRSRLGADLAVLNPDELTEFVALLASMRAAIS